ncbi:alpha/beta fold hydrolase [Cohnella thermotolerans]|uniref:alpha/beta fold hydrolase n=1 Tax=Cohnella thermotolerans TaxID=329858 RepID=UPI000687B83F|nr:alpha/beta hydrolase [Cohnella thermotolerans]
MRSEWVDNNGCRIHYLDTGGGADLSFIPLVICPGLSMTAEEYAEFMASLHPRRCVALSFRGRGRSDSPPSGYDLAQHVSDLEAVIDHLSLNGRFHLFAYSRGVSYALGYASRHEDKIASLMLQDYPAIHKRMPDAWADDYIHSYLIPFGRTSHISEVAVRGIQAESTQMTFERPLSMPALLLRGLLEGSLLPDEEVERYRRIFPHLRVEAFSESGHDIQSTEPDKLHRVVRRFLEETEAELAAKREGKD